MTLTFDRDSVRHAVREALAARGIVPPGSTGGGGDAALGRGMSRPSEATKPPVGPKRRQVVTEADILDARATGRVEVGEGAIVTVLARETAAQLGIALVPVARDPASAPEPAVVAPAGSPPGAPPVPCTPSPALPTGHAEAARPAVASLPVVALGADHGGVGLKELLKTFIEKEAGYAVLDVGTHGTDSVDYPDFAHRVAGAVARGEAVCGILVDGIGIGSCMAANRHAGVRAAAAHGILEVVNAREHNDANVLCLGGRLHGELLAKALVSVFLSTPFAGGRHAVRVRKIDEGLGPGGRPCSSPA